MSALTQPRPPGPNDPCWCGSGKKYKKCHRGLDEGGLAARPVKKGKVGPMRSVPDGIARPDYARSGKPRAPAPVRPMTADELARMRRSCRAAARVLANVGKLVAAGVTTDALDAAAHAEYLREGGYPSTLNYHGFPKSLCTSVNEIVCHGIPDDRPLEDGDLVNLDVTIFLEGMHGDCNATFAVGKLDAASEQLVRVTRECLERGIEAVKPGRPIGDIGRAIEPWARKHGYSVVRRYGGHGIGESFHNGLHVPHHADPHATEIMEPGLVFTIEPMLSMGTHDVLEWPDGWTVVSADGRRSAQFEHTVVVTDRGAEVLTVL